MPFATTTELATYLQQDLDAASAQLVLDLVEADILEAAGKATSGDCPAWVKGVALAACARVYSNPTGAESESVGPFARRMAASGVLLNAAERSRLSRLRSTAGVWTLSTTRGDALDTRWVPDQWQTGDINGGDLIPFETDPLS